MRGRVASRAYVRETMRSLLRRIRRFTSEQRLYGATDRSGAEEAGVDVGRTVWPGS